MKSKFFLGLLLAVFCSNVRAQDSVFVIKMHEAEPFTISKRDFYVQKVIDARPVGEEFGLAKDKGEDAEKGGLIQVDFLLGMENAIQGYLFTSLPKNASLKPIIVRIDYLQIWDHMFTNWSPRVELMMTVLTENEGTMKEWGTFLGEGKGPTPPSRVGDALKECLKQFAASGWRESETKPILAAQPSEKPYPKGIYGSFYDLTRRKPSHDMEGVEMKKVGNQELQKFALSGNVDQKTVRRATAFSDGESLYFMANWNQNPGYFVKAKKIGQYFLMEDKIVLNSTQGLIVEAATTRQRGIIYDQKTGHYYVPFSKGTMEIFLRKHPDLWKKYDETKDRMETLEEILQELSARQSGN